MKTKTNSPKLLALWLCMVMILSMIPSGLVANAFAAECTHVHTDECLSCESEEHTHADECYEAQLICVQEEHIHTNECYQSALNCTSDEHTHTEECYDTEGNLNCATAEHTHSNECYTQELNCENAEHIHSEECYVKVLTCTQEEHTHTEDCYQNCTHVCGVENAVSMLKGSALRGTSGGTATKLDGDWAYLTKFEILDDPATADVVEGIQDGAGPFDTSDDPNSMKYKDRQGNDENDQNGKVRSFDTVTYKLNYATEISGEYDHVREGWLNYELVLPYVSTSAIWQTDSMAWVGTKVDDQTGLDDIEEQTSGFYLSTETRQGVSCQVIRGKYWLAPNETNPYAIPGEGTLSAVVQVLAMEENDILQPKFSGWMEHNVTYQDVCGAHNRAEIISFTAPATEVTAEVRLDIEVLGSAVEGLSSVNFNSGNADAPNYGEGTLIGKAEAYSIGIYLWNGTLDGKGRKGLMAPKSGDTMTFDLTMNADVVPTSGSSVNLNNTAYAPLLWALGSNDDDMYWRGRSTLTGNIVDTKVSANSEFTAAIPHLRGDDACYDGGAWSFAVDPSDPNKIHVTITSMEIDLTNYPHWTMLRTCYDASGAIPISAGQLQLLQPVIKADGTHIMEDTSLSGVAMMYGDIKTSVKDDNMSYTYVSKTDNQSYTLTNEDQTLLTNDYVMLKYYAEKSSGWYDSHVVWTSVPTTTDMMWYENPGSLGDTLGGLYYVNLGGDPTVRNQNIGAWFGLMHQNDLAGDGSMIVAGKSLLKFDSSAVVPTGNTAYLLETKNGFNYTVLYATKTDGSPWASDEEMEAAQMRSLKYYASISDIPSGHECVGILVEYLPKNDDYTGINPSTQFLYADASLQVKSTVEEGGLYQCTIENYGWRKSTYEALGKNIPSLLDDSATLPSSFNYHHFPEYDKGNLNPKNGHLENNTPGPRNGDVMQVIAARSIITKEVAQQENGIEKSVFYMDSDQRFVDYKLNVATEFVTLGVAVVPEGVATTLTIMDAMPSGIKYVPNSAYYGGTYIQNPVPGRQGTITGGVPLELIDSWESDGFSWYKFEIPNVIVGEPLEPIYLTAKIGTRGIEETDVTDGQHIKNNALSQVGKEITTTQDDIEMNQAFAEIIISKNGATSRSKLADKTYIEKDDMFEWTINVGNNGGNTMPNTIALDVLPYNGDGQGTVFNGTLSLTKWNIDTSALSNLSSSNWKIMYTTDSNVRGTKSSEYATDVQSMKNGAACGPKNVVFTDITTLAEASVDWSTGVVTLPDGFSPTAMVMVGSLPGNQTVKVDVQLKIANAKQGDILVNQLDGYPVPVYTVKRAIEGCTWIDANQDGVRQDSETMLPGVTATLYKLKTGGTATSEDDYEVVKDKNGNVVSVETDKQKDAVTGTQTEYTVGRYQFTNLPAGTYAVKFTDGTAPISDYTATTVNVEPDDTRDSDATATYNATSGLLEKTVILGIVMDAANDAMKDINQISRNNDSGLYSDSRSLSISKIVSGNFGDREKLFEFTITLKDAHGANITKAFACDSATIEGIMAAAPTYTYVSFNNGTATLQLKHGQKVTIKDLPDHCKYTVAETAVTGYTKTVEGNESNTNLQSDAAVEYTNLASITVPTGILLDIWPYALVVILALSGTATIVGIHEKKKRNKARYNRNNQW